MITHIRMSCVHSLPINAHRAKGGSKADLPNPASGNSKSSSVPGMGKQEEEAWHKLMCAAHSAQYPIWTPKLLMALEKGSMETGGSVS